MKKSKLALFVCVSLVLFSSLFGCSEAVDDGSSIVEVSEVVKAPRIGIIQYYDHSSSDIVREAFLDRIEEWGFTDETLTIDFQGAAGDERTAKEICDSLVQNEADIILAISEPAAQAAAQAVKGTDIKVLFAAVVAPEKNLSIETPEAPSGNITGAARVLQVDKIIDLAFDLAPEIKTMGIVSINDDPDSIIAASSAKSRLESREETVEIHEMAISANEMDRATELCETSDAIFISFCDPSVDIKKIVDAANKAQIPVFSATGYMTGDGALASVDVEYPMYGREVADMAVKIFADTPISQVPVFYPTQFFIYINDDTLAELGYDVPQDILSKALKY